MESDNDKETTGVSRDSRDSRDSKSKKRLKYVERLCRFCWYEGRCSRKPEYVKGVYTCSLFRDLSSVKY